MTERTSANAEAIALIRIASAARDVHEASNTLEKRLGATGNTQPPTLELARFAVAMQELHNARDEFDRRRP